MVIKLDMRKIFTGSTRPLPWSKIFRHPNADVWSVCDS